VLGAATVILAMGEGRKSAASINKMLAEDTPSTP
jgi:NADPH-dependent glutamate synthase beta subunit-like oxidoreductase